MKAWTDQFTWRDWLMLAGSVIGINLFGALPALFVGADTDWFEQPVFYPPEILFPIVWTILFTLMGLALFLVVRSGTAGRQQAVALALFGLQLLLNISWTPVFFGLQQPGWSLLILVALWGAIVATIIAFERIDRLAAALLVPYLLWVSFAFVLTVGIIRA